MYFLRFYSVSSVYHEHRIGAEIMLTALRPKHDTI